MRYVIIGGSIAGIAAAKSISARDAGADITVITAERGKAYYRPMIPYLIEDSERDIDFTENPFERYPIREVHDLVDTVDTRTRNVKLASGGTIAYDKLLIASGGRAVVPDIKGIQGQGSFTLRSRDDADSIREYAKRRKEAIIIGAGLVGIKAAVALRNVGLHVTLVEQLDHILSGRLDERGAEIIRKVLDRHGYNVMTGEAVQEVLRSGGVITGVTLMSGAKLNADIIVIAAGVMPNVACLANSGIAVNRGIVINERLETNVPDIYAAGDVVEYTDTVLKEPAVSALWTNAEEMGRFAGMNMAGGKIKYRGFLSTMNSTEILGIPFVSVGLIGPEGSAYEIFTDDRFDSYRKLVFRGDTLAGFVFLGDIRGAGIYTNLVRNGIAIGELKKEAISGNLEYIDFLRPQGAPVMTV